MIFYGGSMAAEEQVLVIETKVLEELGLFHGLAFDVDKYLEAIFVPGLPRFMSRSQVEKDPSYKQLIPYVIMSCQGKYLSYVRGKKAGEKRLMGNRSIGIGGHINPVDDVSLLGIFETYLEAVEREVAEEVNLETRHSDRIAALLNDDSNEVGQVHLGIVHHWKLLEPKVSKKEQMITQMSFMTMDELQAVKDTMETWSQLCLDGLSRMTKLTTD
jgi:predicted NUDIX family phosphoesterase